nr:unnamed protein product [Spirometra erinaceieuropaei]
MQVGAAISVSLSQKMPGEAYSRKMALARMGMLEGLDVGIVFEKRMRPENRSLGFGSGDAVSYVHFCSSLRYFSLEQSLPVAIAFEKLTSEEMLGRLFCLAVFVHILSIDLPSIEASKSENVTATIPVDKNAAVLGSCDATTQTLNLTWGSLAQPSFNLSLTFSKLPMSASGTEETVVSSVLFIYNFSDPLFPDNKETGIRRAAGTGPYFNTPSTAFFTCAPQQNITLAGDPSPNVLFGLAALQMEAFRNSTNTDFSGQSFDCVPAVPKDNTIAIAVGVCFAVLIVLAIVVFLIGNRRRAHGYQNI